MGKLEKENMKEEKLWVNQSVNLSLKLFVSHSVNQSRFILYGAAVIRLVKYIALTCPWRERRLISYGQILVHRV